MTSPDWREDRRWQLVAYDEAFWKDRGEPPAKPTKEAELAQPDCWASLYVGERPAVIVATWWRPSPRP